MSPARCSKANVPDDSLGVTVPGYLPGGSQSREEMAAFQGAVRQADMAVGEILGQLEATGRTRKMLVIFAADHGIAMPRAKWTPSDQGRQLHLSVHAAAMEKVKGHEGTEAYE